MATVTFDVRDLSLDPEGTGESIEVTVILGTTAGPGGSGAVDSVNGQTGVVVLDASDVDADPEGSAAAAQAAAIAAAATDATTKANAAQAAAISAAATDATTKANAAQAAAEATAAAALAAEAVLARNADNLTSGTVADARIASTIARDSEVTAAVSASEAGQVRDGDAAGGVLAGTYPNPSFASDMATQAELDAHVNDTSDAHDASAISFSATGTVAATDVQAAIAELDTEKATTGSVTTVANDLAAHLADATDAHDASAISFTPTGTIAATDVQAAIAEVASEAAGGVTDLEGLSDVDLTSPANDDFLQQKAGVFVNRTVAQVKTDLALPSDTTTSLAGKVDKSTLDANTILYATADDTPAALAVAASQIVGRKASGDIAAMTAAETKTVLAIAAADVSDFSEAVDDRVDALITDGTGVTSTYDDGAGTLTLAVLGTTINAQTGTSYTLVIGDAGKFVTMSNASASTLTVPPNSSVAFPVGTVIEGAQLGAGQVTLTPGSGVTINGTPGLKIAAQYGSYGLIKTATDTWLAVGRLAA